MMILNLPLLILPPPQSFRVIELYCLNSEVYFLLALHGDSVLMWVGTQVRGAASPGFRLQGRSVERAHAEYMGTVAKRTPATVHRN